MNAAKSKLIAMKKRKGAPNPKRKRGATKLREAADEILSRDCNPIVEALSSNGKKGQIQSARFLYGLAELAEASTESEGGARMLRSIALEWANSPEWNGEAGAEKADEEDGAD
jgi:hypothetical protein